MRLTSLILSVFILACSAGAGFLPPAPGGRVIYKKYAAGKSETYALYLDTGEVTRVKALEKKGGGEMRLLAFTPDWDTLLLGDSFSGSDTEEATIGIYILNSGEKPELILNWESVPGFSMEAVYDETEGVFYISRRYDIFDGEDYRPKTQVFKYELRAETAVPLAEFDYNLRLAGGFFNGNLYVEHIHYYSQENSWEKYYGYIGKDDGEIRDLEFVLRDNESWLSNPVIGVPDEQRSVPPYFYVRKRIDFPGESSNYDLVYVCDLEERNYYRLALVQWAVNKILYSRKTDALVYISYIEGDDWSPKIVVHPVENGVPWKIFPLSYESTPGYKYKPSYRLIAVE